MRAPAAVLIIALQAAVLAGAASDLPLNQWVKLDTPREAGYTYSQPVYVPSRGAVLHWGAVAGGDYRAWMRNDVRAFDAQALRWRPDYPVAEKLPGLKTGSSAGKGLSYVGHGEMLACGTPAPSMIANGVCYDSTRDQVVVTMKGLMAAYDPKARKWRHVEAKTVLYGQEVPGGPPVYGVGTAYDPVNDQIVLFPQWGGKNVDRRELTGEVSAHLGTFRYSFEDDTWRRVGHTFGSDTVRAARQRTLALMGELSTLLDGAWRLRRQPRPAEAKVLGEKLAALRDRAAGAAGQMPKGAGRAIGQALGPLAAAAASAATGRPSAALSRGSEALRRLDAVLDGPLRVQPPPRCGTPLVTHPEAKVIVMFGGHSGLVRTDLEDARHHGGAPGALNDTWLYDLATRQWHELPCPRRPLPTLWPKMVYDPASRLVLLVTRTGPWANKKERVITLWGLDVTEGRWSKLHQQPWTWDYGAGHATGWRPDPFEVALDRDDGLLLLTQNVRQDRTPVEQVFAFRLDIVGGTSLSRENKDAGRRRPAYKAPDWEPPPPVQPIEIPPDDPQWVATLKGLPPNRWVHAKPPRESPNRGWGIAVADPVRGWVVYYGGGHATYQVNNPDVYVVGANRWVTTAGEHNDWVPPVGWGGVAMGYRGGAHAHHQRNEYVAIDGRVYVSIGTESRRWGAESAKRPGPRYAWFHDIDRGGVWRQLRIREVDLGEDVPGTYAKPCVVHPRGQVLGFGGALEPYDGRLFEGENYFAAYDIYANTLAIGKVPPPFPGIVYEYRPFCTLPDRDQVFFLEYVARKGKPQRRGTWVYDLASGRFVDLAPAAHPTADPGTVVYLADQDAVFAPCGRSEQWVYSFEHNTWAPLPLRSDEKFAFDPVYTQVVYVPQYGVLVGVGHASGGTAVMRPDVSAIAWTP